MEDPALDISRELAWIEFNNRVLEEALDEGSPHERLKFIAIFGTNPDEYFMIRVAALKQQVEAEVHRRSDDGRLPQETLEAVFGALHGSLERQMKGLNEHILPALETHGIRLLRYDQLVSGSGARELMRNFFDSGSCRCLRRWRSTAGSFTSRSLVPCRRRLMRSWRGCYRLASVSAAANGQARVRAAQIRKTANPAASVASP